MPIIVTESGGSTFGQDLAAGAAFFGGMAKGKRDRESQARELEEREEAKALWTQKLKGLKLANDEQELKNQLSEEQRRSRAAFAAHQQGVGADLAAGATGPRDADGTPLAVAISVESERDKAGGQAPQAELDRINSYYTQLYGQVQSSPREAQLIKAEWVNRLREQHLIADIGVTRQMMENTIERVTRAGAVNNPDDITDQIAQLTRRLDRVDPKMMPGIYDTDHTEVERARAEYAALAQEIDELETKAARATDHKQQMGIWAETLITKREDIAEQKEYASGKYGPVGEALMKAALAEEKKLNEADLAIRKGALPSDYISLTETQWRKLAADDLAADEAAAAAVQERQRVADEFDEEARRQATLRAAPPEGAAPTGEEVRTIASVSAEERKKLLKKAVKYAREGGDPASLAEHLGVTVDQEFVSEVMAAGRGGA